MAHSSFVRPAALALALAMALAATPAAAGRCGRSKVWRERESIPTIRGARRTATPVSPQAVRTPEPATAPKAGATAPAGARHWDVAPVSAPGEHPVLILRGGSR